MKSYLRTQFSRDNYMILLQFLLISIGVMFIVELFNHQSLLELFNFFTQRPWAVIYNIVLIYFTLCFSLFFNKRRFWLTFIAGLWIGISIANAILMRYRSMPLTPRDIFLMSSVRDIFEIYLSPVALVGLMLLISVVSAFVLYVWISVTNRGWIPVFAAVHILGILFLLVGINKLLVQYQLVDPTDSFYNLAEAYERNGFAYCFSAGFTTGGVDEPDDYSSLEVEDIVEGQHFELPHTVSDPPNIIFVQLESFFDPYYMKNLDYSVDPIPNFRALKESCSHGLLSVPCVGAGTANTEFEVLTGMNLSHFGVGEYPYITIVDSDPSDSMVSELWKIGYDTHALHNNNATFYNRHIVYDNLGFETFTSVEYMTDIVHNPLGWAKDICLTEEIMKCLEDDGEKDFVFTVSVEPHGRYPKEPIEDSPIIPVIGMEDEERKNGFEYYLYALSESDRFVGELIQRLYDFPERTMVVFYGDHLPSFNIENEELSYGTNQTTEYVIWTNYNSKAVKKDLQTYQLSAYALEIAGIYEGPVFRLHQSYRFDGGENDAYQEELQLLEYDMIYGESYATEDERNSKPPLKYGVSEILLTDILPGEEQFSVKGENFTGCSVLYVNEKPLDTVFVSPEELVITGQYPIEGDSVYVAQVSAVDPLTVLSKSKTLICGT